jgi:pilus assembly protein CpaB
VARENPLARLKNSLANLTYRQWLILALVVSVLLGGAVFYSLLGAGDEEAPKAMPSDKVKVVVAKQDIPERALVKESMLQVKEVPQDLVPDGAVNDITSVVDRPASVPIQTGDVLTEKKILIDPRMAGFTGLIPDNCRAISFGISDVTGVAGFAKPGDYVDIMLVTKNGNKTSGQILLQNVLLLGLNKTAGDGAVQQPKSKDQGQDKDKDKDNKDNKDQKQDQSKSGDQNKNGNQQNTNIQASKDSMATATVALTPEDALKLAVASQQGTIYIVLRPFHPRDIFTVNTDFFLLTDTNTSAPANNNNAPKPAAPAPAAPAAAPRAAAPAPAAPAAASVPSAPSFADSVEVIRGTDVKHE